MKERPTLFNGPMVRAILDGVKTQTRRVIKSQPEGRGLRYCNEKTGWEDWHGNPYRCPYGKPGDQLWVRETWRTEVHGGDGGPWKMIGYAATDNNESCREVPLEHSARFDEMWDKYQDRAWRPSIHMPRWASRIQILVKDVRVERVQDISEEDARAEGVPPNWCGDLEGWNPDEHGFMCQEGLKHLISNPGDDWDGGYYRTGREAFQSLWNSINEKRDFGWDKNPWVWVVEFEKMEKDQ